jgi:membrane fusion protein (multidrug efflux system)
VKRLKQEFIMNKLGTFLGLIILLTAALGIYYLFQAKQNESPEEPQSTVATEVSVHVGKISRSTLYGYILAYGRIEPAVGSSENPPARVPVTAPAAGIVSEVKCVEGQAVNKGDLLFRLDSRIAEVAVKKAQQALEFEERNFTRQKELLDVNGTSEKLLQEAQHNFESAREELAKANTELSLLQVTAPISGTVVRVLARPAESVDMSYKLAELLDIQRLIVEFRIPSTEASLLKAGQKVEIETGVVTQDPNSKTVPTGEVTFIDSVVDPQSDTVLVRASTPPGAGLKSGQFVKAHIVYVEKKNCLVVPEESLVTTTEGQTVIAVVENGKAFQRIVHTGLHQKGLVEIQGEGIHEGMQIVTTGAYGLLPETNIRIVTE